MPWRPPICPPRPTNGRGRRPGASGPPQTGGPAHRPGRLAPGALRSGWRGPWARPAGADGPAGGPVPLPRRRLWLWRGFFGVLALVRPRSPAPGWARSSCGPPPPPGPGLRLPLRGPGPWSVPAPAPCLGLSARALARRGAAGVPPSPPAAPPGAGGGPGGAALPRRPGVGPPSPAPPGRPGSPLLPSGRPCVGWAALRLLRARPCGRSLRASGPAPPRRGAAGPLRGPVGPLCGPPAALPRRCAVGHSAPSLAAARQLARGAGKQGEYDPAPTRSWWAKNPGAPPLTTGRHPGIVKAWRDAATPPHANLWWLRGANTSPYPVLPHWLELRK